MDHKLLLLGLLRRQGMHGYQLFEFIERDMAVCTDLKKSTAYYLLNKMAEDGWIAETLEQEGNRPPRRVYRLTPQGEIEFQRMLRANLASHAPVYFPGDIGLAFLDNLDPTVALTLLRQRRQTLAGDLDDAQRVPAHAGSIQLVIEHRARYLRAELEWLDEVLVRFEANE